MIDLTPSPIAFAIGPLTVHWYGIAYAVGLAAAYLVIAHEARWRGLDVRLLPNAMIVVAIAALIGPRLYHVLDQWQLYKDDPLKIVLPPYSGLGVYGGIIAGTIAAVLYARWKHQPFLRWAEAVVPGLFVMWRAAARAGSALDQTGRVRARTSGMKMSETDPRSAPRCAAASRFSSTRIVTGSIVITSATARRSNCTCDETRVGWVTIRCLPGFGCGPRMRRLMS